MKRKSELYLQDILDSIERIKEYTEGQDIEDFKNNRLVIDASVRNLEIIGEAASQLSGEVKTQHKVVPWQEMVNFRNVVIHKYHQVDIDILWDIIENRLEPLRKQVEKILNKK